MLCHLYVVLLVLYIAVPSYVALLMQYISVPSVLRTVGAIHCCAICTVHCWCHIMLCHLYVALLVPYIAVPFVCTAELFYFCQCAVLLKPVAHCTELSCLSVSTALLSAVLFHSIPNFFNSPPKPDTLPHNALLSTKWREISVRRVIQCCLQQNYRQLISGTVQSGNGSLSDHQIAQ